MTWLVAALVAAANPPEFIESFEGRLYDDDGGEWYRARVLSENSLEISPFAAKSGDGGLVAYDVMNMGNLTASNQAMLLHATARVGERSWWRVWLRVDSLSWDTPSNGWDQYCSLVSSLTTGGYPGASLHIGRTPDGGNGFYLGYSEGTELDGHSISGLGPMVVGQWHLAEVFQSGIGSASSGELAVYIDGTRRGGATGKDFRMDAGVESFTIGVGFQFPESSTMQVSFDEVAVRKTAPPSRLRVRALDAGVSCTPVEVALTTSADGGLAGALVTADVELEPANATLHLSADCSGEPVTSVRFDAGESAYVVYACATGSQPSVAALQGNYLPGATAFGGEPGGACDRAASSNPSLFSVCAVAPAGPLLLLLLLSLSPRRGEGRGEGRSRRS